MSLSAMRLTVLGTRGSCPISGQGFAEFGGDTSCYLVEAGDQTILLDAGSGLIKAPVNCANPPAILLSHLHADHLIGLGMYGRLSQEGARCDIYVPARDDREAKELVSLLYSAPLWPVELSSYKGDVRFHALPSAFSLGGVTIETEEGSHPGGCKLIRLAYAGKTLVYATDFEHNDAATERLVSFAHDADLLLYDGQYDTKTYETHKGFGHSTPEMGLKIMRRAGAKRLMIVHHDPTNTDEELCAREALIGRSDVTFARENETVEL